MRPDAASAPATWDGHAERYRAQERWEARAVAASLSLADPGPGDRLVDLGTGTGVVLRALAGRPERPRTVVGVDRSPGMLARVGSLPGGWRTLQADATCVPLDDGVADVVICAYVLHLLGPQDRAGVLREAARLLASVPRSRLVITTVWAEPATPGGAALNAALRALAWSRPRAWGGLRPLDPTPELAAAGLVATHKVVLPRGGYPSLVIRARPSTSRPAPAAV